MSHITTANFHNQNVCVSIQDFESSQTCDVYGRRINEVTFKFSCSVNPSEFNQLFGNDVLYKPRKNNIEIDNILYIGCIPTDINVIDNNFKHVSVSYVADTLKKIPMENSHIPNGNEENKLISKRDNDYNISESEFQKLFDELL